MTLIADLRSDMMTGASLRVRNRIAEALARPPAMERGEDPDERRLTADLAEQLGLEAALLFPTCTMANQAALRVLLPEGGVLAASPMAHVLTTEAPATGLTSAQPEALEAERGHPTPDAVERRLGTAGSGPTLVWLENTFMLAAGSVMPGGWQARIAEACARHGARLHLDGSRLWNAAVASRQSLAALAAGAETVSLSLNKALGAPVGAVLAGSREMIDAAASVRGALGGHWRPVGFAAAGALAAMEDWRERMARDHALAGAVAAALSARLGAGVVRDGGTNLVFVDMADGGGGKVVERAEADGLLLSALTDRLVRLAFHAGVDVGAEARIVEIVAAAVAAVTKVGA